MYNLKWSFLITSCFFILVWEKSNAAITPTYLCQDIVQSYNCPSVLNWYYFLMPPGHTGQIVTINFSNAQAFSIQIWGPFSNPVPLINQLTTNNDCAIISATTSYTLSTSSMACVNENAYYYFTISATTVTICPGTITLDYKIPSSCEQFPCEDCIPSFSPEPGKSYVLSAWVKESIFNTNVNTTTFSNAKITISYIGSGTTSGPFTGSGQIIDGWQRIEQSFTVPVLATEIKIKLESGTGVAFFDDIRVFPLDGTMKSYVFDPQTLRLVAELDERNYASIYEYDEEGRLIRTKKETERGIMTIQENKTSTSK